MVNMIVKSTDRLNFHLKVRDISKDKDHSFGP